jgi:hypothetical protein
LLSVSFALHLKIPDFCPCPQLSRNSHKSTIATSQYVPHAVITF